MYRTVSKARTAIRTKAGHSTHSKVSVCAYCMYWYSEVKVTQLQKHIAEHVTLFLNHMVIIPLGITVALGLPQG